MISTLSNKYMLKSEIQSLFTITFQDTSRNPAINEMQIFTRIDVKVRQVSRLTCNTRVITDASSNRPVSRVELL